MSLSDFTMRILNSTAFMSLIQATKNFVLQNKTQLLITVGMVTTAALIGRPREPEEGDDVVEEEDSEEQQSSGFKDSPQVQKSIKMEVNRVIDPNRQQINEDLVCVGGLQIIKKIKKRKSWRRLNRKLNENMKRKDFVEQIEYSSEEVNKDFSMVSDLDSKFLIENLQQRKNNRQRGNKTDYESDNGLSFLREKRKHIEQLSKDTKGSDNIFFDFYQKLAVHNEIIEDEDD